MKTHTNIPVFIVHEGCPHMCVFCSQREISGAPAAETEPLRVRETIESFLARGRRERTEIAFFGGSFTGIGTESKIRGGGRNTFVDTTGLHR